MSLLGRETALSRVASGGVKQVTQLQLDPAQVRIWAGNARLQGHLSDENCRDLIDSMIAEGGQKVAAVVRRINGDPAFDYEVIAGTRRHFAISWLRANSYPDMKFLAQVAELDDEAAFRLADIENRARKDVSDIERARNYVAAIEVHYGGKQCRMAEWLKLSEGWLSKMLAVALMPDAVIRAFASPEDIQLKPVYPPPPSPLGAQTRAIGYLPSAEPINYRTGRRLGGPQAGPLLVPLILSSRFCKAPIARQLPALPLSSKTFPRESFPQEAAS